MNSYCIGKSVVLPYIARYVISDSDGNRTYKEYHDSTVKNRDKVQIKRVYTTHIPTVIEKARKEGAKVRFSHKGFRHRGKDRKLYNFYLITKTITPPFLTLGCDRLDCSGYCNGHDITRAEFINKYCGGVEPEEFEL